MKLFSGLLTIGLTLILISPAWGYQEISVTNGGTVTGKVVLNGKEPPPLGYSLIMNNDTEFCGRISTGTGWRLLDEFPCRTRRRLQIRLCFWRKFIKENPFRKKTPAKVMVEDCVFSPWILVVKDQQPIHITNMDPIIHDVPNIRNRPVRPEGHAPPSSPAQSLSSERFVERPSA